MMNVRALNRSAIATIVFITLLTILAELWAGLKGFLAAVTGHHWVTKSVFALVVFTAVYLLSPKSKDTEDPARLVAYSLGAAVLGSLAIFLFFVVHFLG